MAVTVTSSAITADGRLALTLTDGTTTWTQVMTGTPVPVVGLAGAPGLLTNLTQLNGTALSASNPLPAQLSQGNAALSSSNPLPTQTSDVSTTGALNGDNVVVSVALAGHSTAGVSLAAGTLAATLTPVVSVDGGTTWDAVTWVLSSGGPELSNAAFTNPNSATRYMIAVKGGATHVGVRREAGGSGTANVTVTATASAPHGVRQRVLSGTPTQYRTSAGSNAITAIDQAAAPTVGTTSIQNGGSLTNGQTYNCKVVGRTQFGRTTATAGTARAAGASTGTLRIPITQLTGATHYDVAVSTDADPKFVARITEAQRAAGCVVTAAASGSTPATVTAGGTAGAVDVQVPGTGSQFGTTAAVNTAWVIPSGVTAVSCGGAQYVDFDIQFSMTAGDTSTTQPALTVAGVLYDDDDGSYYMAPSQSYTFGGQTAGITTALANTYRLECRGRRFAHLLVLSLAPLSSGASVDVRAVIS